MDPTEPEQRAEMSPRSTLSSAATNAGMTSGQCFDAVIKNMTSQSNKRKRIISEKLDYRTLTCFKSLQFWNQK